MNLIANVIGNGLFLTWYNESDLRKSFDDKDYAELNIRQMDTSHRIYKIEKEEWIKSLLKQPNK